MAMAMGPILNTNMSRTILGCLLLGCILIQKKPRFCKEKCVFIYFDNFDYLCFKFIFYTFGFPLAMAVQCCESLLLISVLRDQIMITLSRLLSPQLAMLRNSPVMTISSLMHANTRTKGEKTINSVLFLDKKVHFCQL